MTFHNPHLDNPETESKARQLADFDLLGIGVWSRQCVEKVSEGKLTAHTFEVLAASWAIIERKREFAEARGFEPFVTAHVVARALGGGAHPSHSQSVQVAGWLRKLEGLGIVRMIQRGRGPGRGGHRYALTYRAYVLIAHYLEAMRSKLDTSRLVDLVADLGYKEGEAKATTSPFK